MPPDAWNEVVQSVHSPIVIAEDLREKLKDFEQLARDFADILKGSNCLPMFDKSECIAHAMLALRHIEDARMRYWKVIQYAGTWVSSYQK